ncbi:hypothetical protein L195_g029828 [Trifolium pratense]|uniref:Uncharacterized protein n=1 Tax=Trifolium pratense TaxID=57577 RepID=A0A2K3L5V7_TRIPR|nr:hypothetical protein L195_g029828 [Trifolium pratense]
MAENEREKKNTHKSKMKEQWQHEERKKEKRTQVDHITVGYNIRGDQTAKVPGLHRFSPL